MEPVGGEGGRGYQRHRSSYGEETEKEKTNRSLGTDVSPVGAYDDEYVFSGRGGNTMVWKMATER